MNEPKDYSCLGQILFHSLKKHSEKVLLYIDETDESITQSDIFHQSIRTAVQLKKKGITQNDIISTCTHNHKYSCLPLIAAQYLGAACANFDPSLAHDVTIHLLKLVKPTILFVSEEAVEFIERCIIEACVNTELVVFGFSKKYSQFSEYLESNDNENIFYPEIVDEKKTALMLFSSGTTGFPKGICLSHRCVRKGDFNFPPYTITNKNSPVSITFATLYWISTQEHFFNCIVNGYATVFCRKFDPLYTWKLIEKYKVTFLFLTTFDANKVMDKKPESTDCSSLEVLVTGAFPVSESLMHNLMKAFPYSKVVNSYGQTEAGGLHALFDPRNEEEYNLQLKKPLSCGKMLFCTDWKITDLSSEKVLGPNKEGELRVKSVTHMNGYYKMDSSSFFDSDGYFKTGDLAYYDEDDCMYIVDRIVEVFDFKGWFIRPAQLELVLLSHPAVKEVAIIGIPHGEDGFQPMGVLVLNDNYNVSTNELLNYINEKVCDSEKLGGLKILTSLPKTASGKIKRRDVLKLILDEMK